MDVQAKLDRAKAIIEELDSISFVAGESGMGEGEVDLWQGRLWTELRALLGTQQTCVACGSKYQGSPVDVCTVCYEGEIAEDIDEPSFDPMFML